MPATRCERIFEMFHRPAYPSTKLIDRIIRQRYAWPNMHGGIACLFKNCFNFYQVKIARHVNMTPAQCVAPDGHFTSRPTGHGPLPSCDGYLDCLTMPERLYFF